LQSVEKRNSPILTIVFIKNYEFHRLESGQEKKFFKVRGKSEFFILSQGKIEIT